MKGAIPDSVRIQHIIDCIEEIDSALVDQTFKTFSENHVLRIAVVKWLEIMGEAANFLTDDTKNKDQTIEWQKMIGLRHIVVHEYFGINYEIIWEAATVHLVGLRIKLETIKLGLENILTN